MLDKIHVINSKQNLELLKDSVKTMADNSLKSTALISRPIVVLIIGQWKLENKATKG